MFSQLDLLARGVGVGAFVVTAIGVWRSDLGRDARLATLLACLSAAAWTLTESAQTVTALGHPYLLFVLAFPVAGFFWLFVSAVFDDRGVTPARLAPAAAFVALGVAISLTSGTLATALGVAFNVAAAILSLHAGLIVLRGWQGDLVEARRSLRAAILGFAALFAAAEGGTGVMANLDPQGPWATFGVTGVYGAAVVALIGLALGGLFLHGRAPLFAPRPPAAPGDDARIAAAEAVLLRRLNAAMEAGGWTDENLSIGKLARDLATPEHQLRRLINSGLGHRNFAAFLNGYRVAAAKTRLADPAQARTTIAAIAFDVGYGSLSPFNRAFLAATGETPKAWRQRVLGETNAAAAVAAG